MQFVLLFFCLEEEEEEAEDVSVCVVVCLR